jgi:hypothetical protein
MLGHGEVQQTNALSQDDSGGSFLAGQSLRVTHFIVVNHPSTGCGCTSDFLPAHSQGLHGALRGTQFHNRTGSDGGPRTSGSHWVGKPGPAYGLGLRLVSEGH